MTNASMVNGAARRGTAAMRQQIHSGSLLLGLLAGSILTIAAIYTTTQSRLSVWAPVEPLRAIEMVAQISQPAIALII